jgi:hypothetical protein
VKLKLSRLRISGAIPLLRVCLRGVHKYTLTFTLHYHHQCRVCFVFLHVGMLHLVSPVPVAARSEAWVCGRALAGIVCSNPTGGMDVCPCTVFVLSGRGLCDGPILRPEKSYRMWCVSECDQVKSQKHSTPAVNK